MKSRSRVRRGPRGRIAALLAGMALVAACRRSADPPRAVVLISIDTLRADHLPCYGYRGVETPALDRLRRSSVLFENAYSHVPLTLPSHATMLTGLLPYENGVRDNTGFRLSAKHPTLASLLKPLGFSSGAAVSSFVLRRDRGLAEGFDFYDDNVAGPRRERAGPETVKSLVGWARSRKAGRLFLFLHLNEPHAPYEPPEPFRSRYAKNPYDGEIAAADAAVGEFLDFLQEEGIYDGALILLVGDHGEGLGDHGEDEHGVFLYREAVRVPLLLKLPGSGAAATTVRAPAGLTDIVPTVADMLGLPPGEKLPGMSLRRLMRPDAPVRDVYSETLYPRFALGWSDLAALENDRSQYIEAPRPELYDLSADPAERNNLAAGKPPELRRLHAKLASVDRPFQGPQEIRAEEVRTLASLGYLSGAGPAAGGPLPDPKDHVGILSTFRRLFELHVEERFAEVIPVARAVTEQDPLCFSAWEMWADSLVRTGRTAEACDVLERGIAKAGDAVSAEQATQAYDNLSVLLGRAGRSADQAKLIGRAIERGRATPEMINDLARFDVGSGRTAEAITLLEKSGAKQPAALNTLGIALARSGRGAQARAAFEQALAENPQNAEAAFNLGNLSLQGGRPDEAAAWFQKASTWSPGNASALTSLGLAQVRAGRDSEAEAAWHAAIEIDPREYDALFNLALLLARQGRQAEARSWLERFVAAAPRSRYREQIHQAEMLLRSAPSPGTR